MTKPEIYCTLGNTTETSDVIASMIKEGMRGARINTAYCDFDDYTRRIAMVREEAQKQHVNVPIMMDIKGPQLRLITENPTKGYGIEKGIVFPVGSGEDTGDFKDGTIEICINQNIKGDLKEGDTVLIENGTIVTKVLENNDYIYLEVVDPGDGVIRNHMGVNIPGKYLNLPNLTEKDKEVIDYALKENLPWIALSFVRDEKDMRYLQDYIRGRKKVLGLEHIKIGLCAKIEDNFGCINLNKIISEVDRDEFGFMVMIARGDLYNEIDYTKLAYAEQLIAGTCHKRNVPYMLATGVLESMKYHRKPTRAEVGDVWNALRDNPDYLLFSAETSNSKYPVAAVETLSKIISIYDSLNRAK